MFSPGAAVIGLTIAVVGVLTVFLLCYVVSTTVGEWRDKRQACRTRAQRRAVPEPPGGGAAPGAIAVALRERICRAPPDRHGPERRQSGVRISTSPAVAWTG